MTKRRLWVASELYRPEETSTGLQMTRIAEGLASDFDVAVISGRPSYSQRAVRVPRYERLGNVEIHRMPSTRFDKDRLLLRAVNLLTFSLSAFVFALFRLRRGDLVLAVTNPPTLPYAIALAGRLKGARLTLLVHDMYPEVLQATGMLSAGSLVYRLLYRLSAWMFRQHERIFVLGRDMREVVGRKPGLAHERLVIATNWADVDEIRPAGRAGNLIVRENGLDEKILVQFSGNLGRTHSVETVIAAAGKLRDCEDIHFLIVGYGGKASLVRESVNRGQMRNITFLPRQPRERLNDLLTAADITVIPFVDGMYGISVPSRMYNTMAAGVPIAAIGDPLSELALVVEEEEAGWVLPADDANALSRLILSLRDPLMMDEARGRGANGHSAAAERYNLAKVLEVYRTTFFEMLAANDRARFESPRF